ncbi:MAG: hypothetical protein EBV83_07120 [Verrucomicrobia bacterium]|nr:hypothetical protein [Verrucomicrobiota bacterium]
MQNLTVQKVCLALLTLVFFVITPWITSQTLEGNTLPLLSVGGTALFIFLIYGLGERCWMLIPFSLSIEGRLNFLPLNFSIQETAIMVCFGYLILKMIFGLEVSWKLGRASVWVPLCGLLAVLLFHWIGSRDIGIKLLGGSGWGGRKYFQVMIAAFSIPLLSSFPGMRWADLQKAPLLYFLGSFVDIVPDALTTLFPSTAPIIWRIYSGINLNEYGASLLGNFAQEAAVTRIGALAKIGMAVGLVTICYFSPKTWLNTERLWIMPALFSGGVLCAASGFRNAVARYFLGTLFSLYAWMRWRALLVIPVALSAALAMAFTQGRLVDYPLAMQRGLSFLPGNWNFKALTEAKASSEWRERMKELFYKEYFQQKPLLGAGYHYDPELAKRDTDAYLAIAARQAEIGDSYADVRRFIEQRMPHEGLVHTLLVSGVIGTAFFLIFCFSLILQCFVSVSKTPRQEITPLQVWAIAQIGPLVIAFFTLGGDYTNFLTSVCPVVALLFRADGLKSMAPRPINPKMEGFHSPALGPDPSHLPHPEASRH